MKFFKYKQTPEELFETLKGDKGQKLKRDAFNELKKLCQSGVGEAATRLGTAYYNGYFVKRIPEKAAEYFEKAVRLNDPLGYYMAANLYLNGECGWPKDIRKAAKYYEVSAKAGVPRGQWKFGQFQVMGFAGVENHGVRFIAFEDIS